MKLRGLLTIALAALPACTDWNEEFSGACERAATLEIHDASLWRDYVLQSVRQYGDDGSAGSSPRFGTDGFIVTNDWALAGRPEVRHRVIYRNDHYVRQRGSGTLVARAGNLSLHTPSIGHIRSWDCLHDYPSLYR